MSSPDEEDDVWELLKLNKVIVPEGVRRILDDLDFKGVRGLSKAGESFDLIEDYIRNVLGDPDVLAIMTQDEKLKIFGPIFSRCPSKFKLSPGHKVTLDIVSEQCKKIVERWVLVVKLKPTQPGKLI